MLKFSGDTEKYRYPVLYDSIQIVSWILICPKLSKNLILSTLKDEINKRFTPHYGNGARKQISTYFQIPGLS